MSDLTDYVYDLIAKEEKRTLKALARGADHKRTMKDYYDRVAGLRHLLDKIREKEARVWFESLPKFSVIIRADDKLTHVMKQAQEKMNEVHREKYGFGPDNGFPEQHPPMRCG